MSSPPWIWADVGFDTNKKLWFLNLFNNKGLTQQYLTRNIILKNGNGIQYQWADNRGDYWHIRERIYAADVRSVTYDKDGNLIVESIKVEAPDELVPENYAYLTYAYSLKTSKGYVEFFDKNGKLLRTINERWIVVEGLDRKTVGEYPHIRLRVERENVKKIIVTKTAAVISG